MHCTNDTSDWPSSVEMCVYIHTHACVEGPVSVGLALSTDTCVYTYGCVLLSLDISVHLRLCVGLCLHWGQSVWLR